MAKLTIVNTDYCFESIIGLIVSHATYAVALAAYNERDLTVILNDGKFSYAGNAGSSNIELETRGKDLIINLSQKIWPVEFEFDMFPLGTNNPIMENPWEVENAKDFGIWQGSSAYVSFYSEVEEKIKTKYGRDAQTWPDIAIFSRILRNGLAHGNAINITNPNSQSYTWKNRTYGPADNGRNILFGDFAFADLIVLMKELSDNLK